VCRHLGELVGCCGAGALNGRGLWSEFYSCIIWIRSSPLQILGTLHTVPVCPKLLLLLFVQSRYRVHTGRTAVMKASKPRSNSSFATPMPPGCSVGASGFFTTYSTYRFAQIWCKYCLRLITFVSVSMTNFMRVGVS